MAYHKEQEIIELRMQGLSQNEIAAKLGIPSPTVAYQCKKAGLGGKRSNRKRDYSNMNLPQWKPDEAKAIERIKALGGFEYAGGYTNCDGRVLMKCLTCGCVSEQSFVSARKGFNIVCPTCKAEEDKRKEEQHEREKQDSRTLRFFVSMQKRQQRWRDEEESRMRRVHACPICGKATDRRGCCSADCQRTYTNRTHDQNRRARIRNALADNDIQLFGLYERDGGVCHICGGLCDWNDYETREDGSFVAGDDYPSIDHVVPLAKGGEHSWQNVRLAHRRCNYLKSDRLIAPVVDF